MKIKPLWLIVAAVVVFFLWRNKQQVVSLTNPVRRTL